MTQTEHIGRQDQQETNALLVFRVGSTLFCTSAGSVVSIIEPPLIKKLPLTPAAFEGVIDFYGSTSSVICLRKYFNEPIGDRNSKGVIVIIRSGEQFAGFWVDEALDMLSTDDATFHDRDPIFLETPVKQFVITEKQLLLYVDLEKLYSQVIGQTLNEKPGRSNDKPGSGTSDKRAINFNKEEPPATNNAALQSCHAQEIIHITDHDHPQNSECGSVIDKSDDVSSSFCVSNSARGKDAPPKIKIIHQQSINKIRQVHSDRLVANTGNPETNDPDDKAPLSPKPVVKTKSSDTRTDLKVLIQQDSTLAKHTNRHHDSFNDKIHNHSNPRRGPSPASNADYDRSSLPDGIGELPSTANVNNKIIHRVTNWWPALLVVALFLLMLVSSWPDGKKQSASDQQVFSPKDSLTVRNEESSNIVEESTAELPTEDAMKSSSSDILDIEKANTKNVTASTTTETAAGSNPGNTETKPAVTNQPDNSSQYRVVLGLQAETYSITVERPENNIHQLENTTNNDTSRKTVIEQRNHNPSGERTAATINSPAQVNVPATSHKHLVLNETPARANTQLVNKGTMHNWQPTQYEEFIYVVVKGDTLWDIAAKYLGDPFKYKLLSELSYVRDPDWIYPGDIVRIRKVIQSKPPQ